MSCGLHDLTELEQGGVPAVLVHTHSFSEAALRQAEMRGQPDLRRVAVPHPVQDKTVEEIKRLASESLPGIVERLSA